MADWHKPDCEWKRSVDIMENRENGDQVVIGLHCYNCKATYYYPKLAELGETKEFELVDPREFTKKKASTWQGKPLDQFTKEELIEIVIEQGQLYEQALRQHSRDLEVLKGDHDD